MPTTWHQRREQEEPLLAAMDATTNTNHACQVDHMFFLIEQQQHNFPASSELDGALRLPWRGGFGSGIQTTSSISGGRGPAAGAARLGGVLRELRRLFLRSLLEFGIFGCGFLLLRVTQTVKFGSALLETVLDTVKIKKSIDQLTSMIHQKSIYTPTV